MKRVFALLLILLLIGVTGCLTSDSDNDGDKDSESNGYTVSGHVVDEEGNGIPGVKVTLSNRTAKIAEVPTTYTDDDGYYTFSSVQDGDYTLQMEKEGYSFNDVNISVNGTNTNAGTTSTSDSGATENGNYSISGKITKENGDGVPNIAILANIVDSDEKPVSAVTDTKGAYTLSGLENGQYMLMIMSENYQIEPFFATVTIAGANVTQNFTAVWNGEGEEGVTVSGTVTNQYGDTVSQVYMEILVSVGSDGDFNGSAMTDKNGKYAITNVPPGKYTLQWSRSGDNYTTDARLITVGSENITEDAVIQFTGSLANDGYTISGTIISLSDHPTSGVTALLTNSDNTQETSITDETGYYIFENVPNGTYTVALSKEGYTITPSSFIVSVDNGDAIAGVSLIGTDSGNGDEPVDTFIVSGRIEDKSGNGLSGIGLTLAGDTNFFSAVTDASGNYQFTAVPPGTYTLVPESNDYTFSPQLQTVTVEGNTSVQTFAADTAGGGNEPDEGDAGGDAGSHEYFPMKRGMTRTVKSFFADTTTSTAIVGTVEIDGLLWWRHKITPGEASAYFRIDNGLVYQYYPVSGTMSENTPYRGIVMNLDLNASPGETFDFIDFTSSGQGVTTVWTGTGKYIGKEGVTVEAGTFNDCRKYELTVEMTTTVEDFVSRTVIVIHDWYAKDVGFVKETMTTLLDGETVEEDAIELISYTMP